MEFQFLSKVWYFFYFGSTVCVWPYVNLLYRANGLDDAQIGVLAGNGADEHSLSVQQQPTSQWLLQQLSCKHNQSGLPGWL